MDGIMKTKQLKYPADIRKIPCQQARISLAILKEKGLVSKQPSLGDT